MTTYNPSFNGTTFLRWALLLAPFWNLFGVNIGGQFTPLSYLVLSIGCLTSTILIVPYLRIRLNLKLVVLVVLVLLILANPMLNILGFRGYMVLVLYIGLILQVVILSALPAKRFQIFTQQLITFTLIAFALDVADAYLPPLEMLFDLISSSEVYHADNRPRAFLDEASTFGTWCFGLAICYLSFARYVAAKRRYFVLLIFMMLTTGSALIYFYILVIILISGYRIRLLHILPFSVLLVILFLLINDDPYFRYMFFDKIVNYVQFSGEVYDSGSIRGIYLTHGYSESLIHPFGIGSGNSVGLILQLAEAYGFDIAENVKFGQNSAFLNGIAQFSIEFGFIAALSGLILVFFSIMAIDLSTIRKIIVFFSIVAIFSVIAPIYSPAYTPVFLGLSAFSIFDRRFVSGAPSPHLLHRNCISQTV